MTIELPLVPVFTALGVTIGFLARELDLWLVDLRHRRELRHWEHENERVRAELRYDGIYDVCKGPIKRFVPFNPEDMDPALSYPGKIVRGRFVRDHW